MKDCHYWGGVINAYGYGIIFVNGKYKQAHRIVWESEIGEIPQGLVINHLCKQTRCINTNHLEVTTSADNVMKGVGVGVINKAKTHCYKGHKFTKDNTYIDKKGWRYCNECRRIKQRFSYHKKKG